MQSYQKPETGKSKFKQECKVRWRSEIKKHANQKCGNQKSEIRNVSLQVASQSLRSQRFRWFSWNSSLTAKPASISDLRLGMNVPEQVESNHKPGLAEMPRNRGANVEFETFPISSRKSERMNRQHFSRSRPGRNPGRHKACSRHPGSYAQGQPHTNVHDVRKIHAYKYLRRKIKNARTSHVNYAVVPRECLA